MHNQKILYIIPGYGETSDDTYQSVAKAAAIKGYKPYFINIEWDTDKVMDDYVNEALEQIHPQEGEHLSGLGFSFGAYILALLSVKVNFNTLFFCSLSPYFQDDIHDIPEEAKKELGEKFMENLKKNTFPDTSYARAIFMVGEEDWPQAIHRAEKSFNLWKGEKEKFVIPNTSHSLNSAEYQDLLSKIL